jgi:glycosyltransferase involved in cell wall biosynthesis
MPLLSIVSPVYGCQKSLHDLYARIRDVLSGLSEDFEIIFVNDASPDTAWETIKELALQDPRVKGINLVRNFGQHKAISAGLDHSRGDWVVIMDCDLQDRPEEIPRLYAKAQEGYDAVFGQRLGRQDSRRKRWTSRLFIAVYDYLSDSKTDPTIGNFSLISRKVVNALKEMTEQHHAYTFLVIWLGFKRAYIEVEHAKREAGQSSYNFKRLIRLAIDNIVSQSNKPLRFSIKFGFAMSLLSALYAIYLVLQYFLNEQIAPGWTSVMVSIYFIGGLLFANLGIIGLYIGKIFDETKKRPLYVIDEIV